jgi:hypothetical protein
MSKSLCRSALISGGALASNCWISVVLVVTFWAFSQKSIPAGAAGAAADGHEPPLPAARALPADAVPGPMPLS